MSDPQAPNPQDNEKFQQDVLTKLAFASLTEQRRARRWGIFFKSLFAFYLFLVLIVMLASGTDERASFESGKHTSLVDIKGVIGAGKDASADNIITGLRDAFEDKNTVGVILRINSPGGSPVQAGYIYDEIKRLRGKYPKMKVYAVITDICASGGYYIASAADEIYADKASLVGSIGVIMNGFGFVDTLKKLGVERRLYTAGTHKGFLDPFSPEKEDEVAHVHAMLDNIHKQFIDAVKAGRGNRLKDNKDLFSGLIWTGQEGLKLGLVDGLASSSAVARDVIKAENIVNYTPRPNYWQRIADRIGASAATKLGTMLHLDGSMLPQ
ncbi:MAG: S49 family peptidase [Gammaproteobacteria bacterium]|nr:S49 family peptidase [Gammaproteobacteria bacterium]